MVNVYFEKAETVLFIAVKRDWYNLRQIREYLENFCS